MHIADCIELYLEQAKPIKGAWTTQLEESQEGDLSADGSEEDDSEEE